ncbi:MAG: protecting protein DprA [Acidobacteria bacterium]|nr:protecting protein DprA [Acidobacteriota bacterium]
MLAGESEGDPAIDEAVRSGRPARVLEQLAATGWSFLPAADPGFPALLDVLADPPLGLFVRGALPDRPPVAVVGARHASAYGREVAEYLGRELAAGGACVVSGMARGVDGAAHRGALAAGGPTVAVWGAGPDRVYPREHAALAEEIAAAGALVTEYPPGSPPLAAHFPERNRLIAGLAKVVVVVEADERSGALVTARLALDEGRDVMAVPGSVFSRMSAGPNGLLRAGAAPVLSAADVLGVLGLAAAQRGDAEPEFLRQLPAGTSATVDELAAHSGLPVARLLELLLELELAGWLVRESDGRYRRSHAR